MLIKSDVVHITCPYCNNSYNVNHNYAALNRDKNYGYAYIRQISCLNCMRKFLLYESTREIDASEIEEIPEDVLGFYEITKNDLFDFFSANPEESRFKAERKMFIRPLCSAKPAPKEIDDEEIMQDFNEAAMILEVSPRASAALSRKCLKKLLQKKAPLLNPEKLKLQDLLSYMTESAALSTELITLLHYVIEMNNFNVNPMKNEYPALITDVTKEEAKLNLDVLLGLFDIYYVNPAKNSAIKERLEEKLKSYGRNLL